jgi:signal transduction histidine kinase/ligand-binding sensor domain-containing protein
MQCRSRQRPNKDRVAELVWLACGFYDGQNPVMFIRRPDPLAWPQFTARRFGVSGWPWACVLALLAAGAMLAAGAAELAAQNFFVRSWKTDSGLPNNVVTAIIQTRDGYLWVGTYGGLARFDGVRFTVFNTANTPELQSDRITSLYEDAQGILWIGHERGDLTSYRNGKFEPLEIHEPGVRRKISAINADEAGDIWMLNDDGTLERIRDGLTCSLPNNDGVALMKQAASGQLWVVSGSRMAPLKNGQLIPLPTASDPVGNYVLGICPSHDGQFWVASDGLVRKWNGQTWTQNIGANPRSSSFSTMLQTKSGAIALGTVDSGLYLLYSNQPALHFCHTNGFPNDWIRFLFEDREGTLWLGAGSEGLVAVCPSKVETVYPPDHWQGCVPLSATADDDNGIWVGTEGAGLYHRLNTGEWKHFGSSEGISNQFVWCVSEDESHQLWAGTWGGGVFVEQGDHFVTPAGLENVIVPMPAILHARDGVTWIGTASGLLRYQARTVKWFDEKEGLKLPDVRAIEEVKDGTVWFGMVGGGLGRLQNGKVEQFFKRDGLSSDYLICLHLDTNGSVWIGTDGGGLCRYKNGRFSKINSANGLPSNSINGIEDDEHGNFWISSNNGIFRVSQQQLNNCADGGIDAVDCLEYGLGDGMPSLQCSGGMQPSLCRTADGRLWFPTSGGVAVINPESIKINHLPPPVIIEEIIANGHTVADHPQDKQKLRIPPGLQRFEFHYTGLSFIAPNKMRFQYRLEGWEKDWQDAANNKRFAEYSYIPPGDYTFHVRACNSDGIWNDTGASLEFTLLPHFWQTYWFRAVAVLVITALVAGSGWLISRRRMRAKLERIERLQAVERERTRIAKDIHDHLGANLTRISLLSQSVHGDLENPKQAGAQLDRIYDTSRELTRSLDEIVWAVNPKHDTLDSLASYLGNFAQEYLVSISIRCRLDVPLQLPHWPITAELRHNVFLAFKEALHNIVKHSGATRVAVSLSTDAAGFNVIIQDNGKGFDVAAAENNWETQRLGRGNGLKNLRQRLEKIGGRCEIKSETGSGTEIKFFVSVPASVRETT